MSVPLTRTCDAQTLNFTLPFSPSPSKLEISLDPPNFHELLERFPPVLGALFA